MVDGGLYLWSLLSISANGRNELMVVTSGRYRHDRGHVRGALTGHGRRHSRAASSCLWRVRVWLHAATTELLWGHPAATLTSRVLVCGRRESHLAVVVRVVTATAASTSIAAPARALAVVAHVAVLGNSRVSSRVERHLRHRVGTPTDTLGVR